jgi:DNA-binding transcriptional regulator YiaG
VDIDSVEMSIIDSTGSAQHNDVMEQLPTMTAEELRAIREELGLKQYEAPKLFGVALLTYKRWELGDRKIPGPAVILARKYRDEHRKLQK